MTYDIRIKGFKDLLRVDDGQALKDRWEKFIEKQSTDQIVSAGDWTGRLSDITAFRKAPATRSDNEFAEIIDQEYLAELRKLRSTPVADRAKLLGMFRLLFWGFTKKKSEERPEVETAAIKIQEKFFTENPLRTICDPILFRPMFKRVTDACDPAVIRTFERVIRQDRFAVKNL